MNKSTLVISLTRVLSTKKECLSAVDRIFSEMAKALSRGERITISGFGSFHPYISRARRVVNPVTKQVVDVPPKRRVKFIPSKDLF